MEKCLTLLLAVTSPLTTTTAIQPSSEQTEEPLTPTETVTTETIVPTTPETTLKTNSQTIIQTTTQSTTVELTTKTTTSNGKYFFNRKTLYDLIILLLSFLSNVC